MGEGGLTNHLRGRRPQLDDGDGNSESIVDHGVSTATSPVAMGEVLAPGPTLTVEMSTPHPAPEHDGKLEFPVDELLRRATVHPPYGEQVIDDLTPEEADAFLDAVLS